jgi:hypothetical protein
MGNSVAVVEMYYAGFICPGTASTEVSRPVPSGIRLYFRSPVRLFAPFLKWAFCLLISRCDAAGFFRVVGASPAFRRRGFNRQNAIT